MSFLRPSCTKFGFASDRAGGSYNAPPDSTAGFEGPISKGKERKERQGNKRRRGWETPVLRGVKGKWSKEMEREEKKCEGRRGK